MASFSAISSQCGVLVRHGRNSPLSPLFQQPSSPSHRNSSFSSPSTAGFGLSRLAFERKSAVRAAAVVQLAGSLMTASGLRFAVVVARFNEIVTNAVTGGSFGHFQKIFSQWRGH